MKYLYFTFIAILYPLTSCGMDITLMWDGNKEPFLSGYKIYYGYKSGPPYSGHGANEGDSPITVVLKYFTDNGIIIDNRSENVLTTGSWKQSSGQNYYRSDSVYSKTENSTFRFIADVSGYAEISMWWTIWESRCVDTEVRIYSGETLRDTIFVNQKENGGKWNVLGNYIFNNKAGILIISKGGCSVNADAVRLIYLPGNFTNKQPKFKLTGLNDHTVYYFAVTAHDGKKNESGYSNEINTIKDVIPLPIKKADLNNCKSE